MLNTVANLVAPLAKLEATLRLVARLVRVVQEVAVRAVRMDTHAAAVRVAVPRVNAALQRAERRMVRRMRRAREVLPAALGAARASAALDDALPAMHVRPVRVLLDPRRLLA